MVSVYILGEARGSYRVQSFIKLLLDNRKKYKVYYDSVFYRNPLTRYLKSLIINPFVILFSNLVYVNTLNVDLNIFYELLWARLLGKKILVDYYVSVYDTVVLDRKWFGEGSLMAKLAKLLDRFFFAVATRVAILTEEERSYYLSLAGTEKYLSKTLILPLGIERREKVSCTGAAEEGKPLSVCWWGSYQPLHGLDKLLDAAQILKQKAVPVHFTFFGNDEKKGAVYADKIKAAGLDDICELRDDCTFANGKLEACLNEQCELALGAFGDSEKARTVLINKALEACTMGCLVLTGRSKAMEHYFGNGDTSVYFCEGDGQAIAESIAQICASDAAERERRIRKTEEIFRENFEIKDMLSHFEALIDLMFEKRKRQA